MLAYLKYTAKSVLAFASLLATNVATLWVTNGQPLPTNRGEWITFGVTTIGGTWLVWGRRNGPKPEGTESYSATQV